MMETAESLDMDARTGGGGVSKKERNFPALQLQDQSSLTTAPPQPVFVVQSPKTPTLSRKLKAVSLDSEPQQQNTLEVSRDVFSMPNTPKKQIKPKLSCDFDDGSMPLKSISTLAPSFNSNLKKFASNNSISGSQTLKTLPEVNALQDFSDCPNPEPSKVRTRGLLERRGSNASLTIDLGSAAQNVQTTTTEIKASHLNRLNTAKSVSNLYLSSTGSAQLVVQDRCGCVRKSFGEQKTSAERRKSQDTCGNCTIYESEPKTGTCRSRCHSIRRCHGCTKSRRKSLSNENLYVPPCGFCEGDNKECPDLRNHKVLGNNRKAMFPRQPDLDSSQLLSDDFKLHLQNIQYLQTAMKLMTVEELRQSCESSRVPKLQQEFWEVPLNLQEKCYVSGSQTKNRYRGVLPNEHSRVHLPGSGYIHANYIKGPDYTETAYIATQGPLQSTCTDFWEMVWHSQCKCIVMLTGLVEKGKHKCELYFPLGKKSTSPEKSFYYVKTSRVRDKFTFDTFCNNTNNTFEVETYEFEEKNEVQFGKYRITYVDQTSLDECQIRQLELSNTELTGVEPRTIYHYWLANWPDHKKTNAGQVLKMAVEVLTWLDCTKHDISESHLKTSESLNLPTITDNQLPSTSETTLSHQRKNSGSMNTFSFDISDTSETTTTTATNSITTRFTFTEPLQEPETISISEFNKEVLTNRCSLDSKLQNFNKMTEFKSHFKRDVYIAPLKLPERKKSAETVRLPVICHCSAGIGRTGCFLAILNGIQQLRAGNNVDILAILCSLRLNRGGMVQTAEQYELIHRVLSLYSETMDGVNF